MNKSKKTNAKLLMAAGILLCLLLFLQPLTGDILHAVFGMLLFILALVHTCKNMKKLPHKKKSARTVDWLILVSLAVLVLSGILLHPLHDMTALKILHKLSAVVFVIGAVIHAVQNRKHCFRF